MKPVLTGLAFIAFVIFASAIDSFSTLTITIVAVLAMLGLVIWNICSWNKECDSHRSNLTTMNRGRFIHLDDPRPVYRKRKVRRL